MKKKTIRFTTFSPFDYDDDDDLLIGYIIKNKIRTIYYGMLSELPEMMHDGTLCVLVDNNHCGVYSVPKGDLRGIRKNGLRMYHIGEGFECVVSNPDEFGYKYVIAIDGGGDWVDCDEQRHILLPESEIKDYIPDLTCYLYNDKDEYENDLLRLSLLADADIASFSRMKEDHPINLYNRRSKAIMEREWFWHVCAPKISMQNLDIEDNCVEVADMLDLDVEDVLDLYDMGGK